LYLLRHTVHAYAVFADVIDWLDFLNLSSVCEIEPFYSMSVYLQFLYSRHLVCNVFSLI